MKEKRIFSTYQKAHHRRWFALLFIASICPLIAAWWLQHRLDLAPCPLCIIQRYGFMMFALIALVGLLMGWLSALLHALTGLLGLGFAAVAGYHLWVVHHPAAQCVADPTETWINRLGPAQWWPQFFEAAGRCDAHLPLIFHLNIPTWSLIGLLVLALAWLKPRQRYL